MSGSECWKKLAGTSTGGASKVMDFFASSAGAGAPSERGDSIKARPPKYDDGYTRMSIGFSPATKARLERAAALLFVKMGKRLSLGETLDLLLDESESVKQMEKAAAKAAKG